MQSLWLDVKAFYFSLLHSPFTVLPWDFEFIFHSVYISESLIVFLSFSGYFLRTFLSLLPFCTSRAAAEVGALGLENISILSWEAGDKPGSLSLGRSVEVAIGVKRVLSCG